MINTLLIGKVIYKMLSQDSVLQGLVGDKIYPIVAENSTTFPYIVYFRTAIQNLGITKDGYIEDLCNYSIIVVSNDYEQSLEIANNVRRVMQGLKIDAEFITIYNNKLISAEENYSDDAFVQRLNFECKVSN